MNVFALQVSQAFWQTPFGKLLVIVSHGSMRFIYVYSTTSAYQTIALRSTSLQVREAVAQYTGLLLSAASGLASLSVFILIQTDIISCLL
jgi:hypothetical protein